VGKINSEGSVSIAERDTDSPVYTGVSAVSRLYSVGTGGSLFGIKAVGE